MDQLDSLLEAAREELATPGPLTIEPQVQIALVAGRARHRARRARTQLAASALVVAAAAAVVLAVSWGAPDAPARRAATSTPSRITPPEIVPPEIVPPAIVPAALPETQSVRVQALESGHEMTATANASYSVDARPGGPRVVLRQGAVLFDVEPLAPGESFVVETAGGVVHVVGTVFAVEVGERGTAVQVFEGHVRVDTPDGRGIDLRVSESWGEGGVGLGSLAERGRRVASARAGEPERRRAQSQAQLRQAREWIVRGAPERALAIAEPRAARDVRWRVVAADALRALGRASEAADAYDAAAAGSERVAELQYGLLAAQIRLRRLDDPSGALRSLDAVAITAADSPLRERGLALEAEAHHALGHRDRFEESARSYLNDYPRGSRRAWLERHLADPAAADPR